MYTDRNPLLTKRPPPPSPAISQTYKVIWSFSSLFPLGKNSSTLAIMQMKAEGSRMRPSRRAHFPVQHISIWLLLLLLLPSVFILPFFVCSCLPISTLTAGIFSASQKDEVRIGTNRGGGTPPITAPLPSHTHTHMHATNIKHSL